MSVCEILWQCLQYTTPFLRFIIEEPKSVANCSSCRKRCKDNLNAVFLPIPGKRDSSVTAFSNNSDS